MDKKLIAKDIAEYWKDNCTDEDFYNNCIENICQELNIKSGVIPNEVYEIWNIIEREYLT